MTPPKIGPDSSSSSFSFDLEAPRPLLPLHRSTPPIFPDIDPNVGQTVLTMPSLGWKVPVIWASPLALKGPVILAQAGGSPPPKKASPPGKSAPPAPAALDPLMSDSAYKIVRDIFLLIESMDLHGEKMIANGGKDTCRYPEFLHITKLKSDGNKCTVIFEPGTKANVDLKIRKSRGLNESRLHEFRLSYSPEPFKDEFPANMVWIGGFEFSPRLPDNVPFYEEVDPPTKKGFALSYFTTGLFSVFAKGSAELNFSKDYLASWGLDKAEYYKEAHTDPFRVPESVPDFVTILRHMKADVPEWINVNKMHGRPNLFDWLSFEEIHLTAHLRAGSLDLPGIGTLQFSRNKSAKVLGPMYEKLQKMEKGDEFYKLRDEYLALLDQTSKVEVHGDSKKLEITLTNPEMSSAEFSDGRYKVELKGLSVKNATLDLPPLKKLIDQIKKGTLKPQLHLKGLQAEKIVFTDLITGTTSTLTQGFIGSLDLLGPGQLKMSGISGEKLEMKQPGAGFELTVKGPQIATASLTQNSKGTEMILSRVDGSGFALGYSGLKLTGQKSSLIGFKLQDSPTATLLNLEEINSSGSIEYSTPDGSISLSTQGNSQLKGLEVSRNLTSTGETEIKGKIGISGNIKLLKLNQKGVFSGQLSETILSQGQFEIEGRLSAGPNPKLSGLKYTLSSQIDQATIDQAKFGILELGKSKITKGKLSLIEDDGDLQTPPKIDVSGTLDLHLKKMVAQSESFNLPGFAVSGTVKDISVTGDAHFVWDKGDLLLERPAGDKINPLSVTAQLEDAVITQDPHLIPGNDLKKYPGNKVVKSKMTVNATLRLGDVERIEFSPKDNGTKRTSGLKRVLVHDVAIENIEAVGVLWAKFPLFHYLRLHGPKDPIKIGTIGSGSDTKPSFIRLGDFEMSLDGDKPVTTFRGFNVELYEVGGWNQYAKIKLPLLKIAPFGPQLVDTGDELIQLDLNLKDLARGGSIQSKPADRPLDERKSRISPAKSP